MPQNLIALIRPIVIPATSNRFILIWIPSRWGSVSTGMSIQPIKGSKGQGIVGENNRCVESDVKPNLKTDSLRVCNGDGCGFQKKKDNFRPGLSMRLSWHTYCKTDQKCTVMQFCVYLLFYSFLHFPRLNCSHENRLACWALIIRSCFVL